MQYSKSFILIKCLLHFQGNYLEVNVLKHLFFSLYKDKMYSPNEMFFYFKTCKKNQWINRKKKDKFNINLQN